MEENINIVSGSFVPAEQVISLIKALDAKIDKISVSSKTSEGENPKWATQATLCKRYDMSKSTLCRYLAPWVEAGKIRKTRPYDGERLGDIRYSIEDADKYILTPANKS